MSGFGHQHRCFCNCRTSAIPSRVRGDTASEPQSVASWSALRARSRVPTSGGSLASPACLAFRAEAFGFFVRPHRHCGHGLGAVSRRGARGFSGVSRRPRAVIREADRSRARVASECVPLELTRAKSSERLHGSAGRRAKTGEGQTGSEENERGWIDERTAIGVSDESMVNVEDEGPKSVGWHDHHGMELTHVREFEPRTRAEPRSRRSSQTTSRCQPYELRNGTAEILSNTKPETCWRALSRFPRGSDLPPSPQRAE